MLYCELWKPHSRAFLFKLIGACPALGVAVSRAMQGEVSKACPIWRYGHMAVMLCACLSTEIFHGLLAAGRRLVLHSA